MDRVAHRAGRGRLGEAVMGGDRGGAGVELDGILYRTGPAAPVSRSV
ncbi:hypothetical protein ACTXG6_09910 [Pseudonocardia sp. Cha107L01]